jgi:hypothetical protein
MASPFQTYTLHYHSGGVLEAQVQLFNGGIFIGNLNFLKEGTVLPANTLIGSIHTVNYHISRFRDVLQILQYEKPLQVHISAGGDGKIMATGFEPVGEQEGH